MPRKLSISRPGVVVPVPVHATGRHGPTKAQARGPSWRRTSRGLYVPSWVDATSPEQRIVEAAGVLPEMGGDRMGGAAVGRGYWFDGLAAGGDVRRCRSRWAPTTFGRQIGIEVTQERWTSGDDRTEGCLPMTAVERSLGFEMRYAFGDPADAVDRVLHGGTYSGTLVCREMNAFFACHRGWDGIARPGTRDSRRGELLVTRRRSGCCSSGCWTPRAGQTLAQTPGVRRSGRHIGTPMDWMWRPASRGSRRHASSRWSAPQGPGSRGGVRGVGLEYLS